MRRKASLAAALAALLLIWGWYFVSPRWTLERMRAAGLAEDSAALDRFVDYDALRSSEAGQMRAAAARLLAIAPDEIRNRVEADIARRHTQAELDRRASPQRVLGIFRHYPTYVGWASGVAERTGRRERIAVRSPNRFHLHDRNDLYPMPEGDLTFRRDGLGWKLVAIGPAMDEFPADAPPAWWERAWAGQGL